MEGGLGSGMLGLLFGLLLGSPCHRAMVKKEPGEDANNPYAGLNRSQINSRFQYQCQVDPVKTAKMKARWDQISKMPSRSGKNKLNDCFS